MVREKPGDTNSACHTHVKAIIDRLFNVGDGVVQQGLPISFTASAAAHNSALFVLSVLLE